MSATPPISQFPVSNGALVPVDLAEPPERAATEKVQRRRNYPDLLKYLIKTCEQIEHLDAQDRTRVREAQVKCVAFYDGRQDGEVRNGQWFDNPYMPGEIIPRSNEYKDHVDKLLMEMCRTDIGLDVEATDKSNSELREAADFLKHRIEVNRARIETEAFLQAEKLSLLLKTISFRYTFFDPKAEGEGSEYKPVMGAGQSGAPQRVTVCRTCGMPQKLGLAPDTLGGEIPTEYGESAGHEVATQEAQQPTAATPCEQCGDTVNKTLEVKPTPGLNLNYEAMPGGAVVTRRPDATSVQLDMNARDVPSSTFLRWRLSLRRCEWEAMFPGRRIPNRSERSGETTYRDWAQSSPSNDSADFGWESATPDITGGEQFEKIDGDLIWLDPIVYNDYSDNKPVLLPGNRTLPPNTKLISLFPIGLCIVKIGKAVLDLYPSNKNKVWTMCVYGLREHALHGAGTMSVIGPCETINDLNAYIQVNILHNSAPREFLRQGTISGDQLPTVNRTAIVNNLEPDKEIIPYAYAKAEGSALTGEVYAFRESLRGAAQEHAGTSSLSLQGAADLKALGTATGVEASRDQAVGRVIPNNKLYGGMVVEWAYQLAELEHDNCTPDKFLRLAGKGEKGEVEFTAKGVKAFFQADVRRDFRIKLTPGSEQPQTRMQDRADAAGFAQIAGQVQNPEILSALAQKSGIDYKIDEWGAIQRAAADRIVEYARICDVILKGGYPPSDQMVEVVLSQVPFWAKVDDEMDAHTAYRDFYHDWWTSDEGLTANPLLRMTVRKVHQMHGDGLVRQAQVGNEGRIESDLPNVVADQIHGELQGQQAQAQTEEAGQMELRQAAAQQGLQAEGEQQKLETMAAQHELKKSDREHALQTKMVDRRDAAAHERARE